LTIYKVKLGLMLLLLLPGYKVYDWIVSCQSLNCSQSTLLPLLPPPLLPSLLLLLLQVWTTPNGIVLCADDRFRDWFGLPSKELVGRSISSLSTDIEGFDRWGWLQGYEGV
jgi:hypothetical protein